MSSQDKFFTPLMSHQIDQLNLVKTWLGSGSVNIFGMPFSGKDTIGVKLAQLLGASFLSSGDIIRGAANKLSQNAVDITNSGGITPTAEFQDLVFPYFSLPEFAGRALVLSMVGRLSEEVSPIREVTAASGHPIKVVLSLEITDNEVRTRWEAARDSRRRANRADDQTLEVVEHRIQEFRQNVLPTVDIYRKLGLLVTINGKQGRNAVLGDVVRSLCRFALSH